MGSQEIKETPTTLRVVTAEIEIGSEGIDGNNHLNNGAYFPLYEAERAHYWKEVCGLLPKETAEKFGITPFLTEAQIRYKRQVFEGDHVSIHTSAENMRSHLQFHQKMTRSGVVVNTFDSRAYMVTVGKEGRPVRLPDQIQAMINAVNTPK